MGNGAVRSRGNYNRRSSLVPALAYPFQPEPGGLPILVFAGNGHISSNQLRESIREKYEKDGD